MNIKIHFLAAYQEETYYESSTLFRWCYICSFLRYHITYKSFQAFKLLILVYKRKMSTYINENIIYWPNTVKNNVYLCSGKDDLKWHFLNQSIFAEYLLWFLLLDQDIYHKILILELLFKFISRTYVILRF